MLKHSSTWKITIVNESFHINRGKIQNHYGNSKLWLVGLPDITTEKRLEMSTFDHMFETNLNSRSSMVLCSHMRQARLCCAAGELGLDYGGFASRHRFRGRDGFPGAKRKRGLRHRSRLESGRLLRHLIISGVKVLLLKMIERYNFFSWQHFRRLKELNFMLLLKTLYRN